MDNEKWSVYGGYGFVLGEFCRQFKDEIIRVPKEETEPPTPKIIYGISTTDNYNVFDSSTLDIETNLIQLMETLDAAHAKYHNKFKIIFISSWFVYGQSYSTALAPLHEEHSCNPTGFYSITKRAAEQLLASYCETFGIKYKILRLANVLGAKDTKVSKKKNALQFLINKLVFNEDIELYDDGKFYRDYIDVRDCAVAIKKASESELPHKIYNISNGKSYLFADLIQFIVASSGSKSNLWNPVDNSRMAFHNLVQFKNVFISNGRLKETGYQPKYTIWETLKEIVDEYKGRDSLSDEKVLQAK